MIPLKINPNLISKALEIYNTQKSRQSRVGEKENSRKDQLSLSEEAQAFQAGMKAVKDSPDVRMAKVEELKALMESGRYKVNSYDIASKIVDDILFNK